MEGSWAQALPEGWQRNKLEAGRRGESGIKHRGLLNFMNRLVTALKAKVGAPTLEDPQ